MNEALTSERSAHKNDLAKILGKVGAIEKNIEDRAVMDEATRYSKSPQQNSFSLIEIES